MRSREGRYHLLAGQPPKPGHGVWAAVTSEIAVGLNDGSEQEAFERSGAVAFLAAPLLRVVGERGRRRLVIGQVRVAVTPDEEAAITLVLHAIWSETGGWHQESTSLHHADEALVSALSGPAHEVSGDARSVAVITGKALAEASRNEVLQLRGLRYELERQIASARPAEEHGTSATAGRDHRTVHGNRPGP